MKRSVDSTPIALTDGQKNVCEAVCRDLKSFTVHLIHGVTGSGKTLLYMALIDKVVSAGKSAIFMIPEISLTPQTLARFYSRYGELVSVVHSGLAPGERADEWKKIKNSEKKCGCRHTECGFCTGK